MLLFPLKIAHGNVAEGFCSLHCRLSLSDHHDIGRNEITEIVPSPEDHEDTDQRNNATMLQDKGWQSVLGEATSSQHHRREIGKPHQTRSLVRGKVSLAQIIQQSKGSIRQNGWSRYKPISIAEKLELENLYVSVVFTKKKKKKSSFTLFI